MACSMSAYLPLISFGCVPVEWSMQWQCARATRKLRSQPRAANEPTSRRDTSNVHVETLDAPENNRNQHTTTRKLVMDRYSYTLHEYIGMMVYPSFETEI